MTEVLAQGKVILQEVRILEGSGDLLVWISLLRGDKSDKVSFFFGSHDWSGFIILEDSRLKRSVNFESAGVNFEGQSIVNVMMSNVGG